MSVSSTAMRGGDIAAQREVLAALIKRVVPVRVGRGTVRRGDRMDPAGRGAARCVQGTGTQITHLVA